MSYSGKELQWNDTPIHIHTYHLFQFDRIWYAGLSKTEDVRNKVCLILKLGHMFKSDLRGFYTCTLSHSWLLWIAFLPTQGDHTGLLYTVSEKYGIGRSHPYDYLKIEAEQSRTRSKWFMEGMLASAGQWVKQDRRGGKEIKANKLLLPLFEERLWNRVCSMNWLFFF